jgi:hypothetical protein
LPGQKPGILLRKKIMISPIDNFTLKDCVKGNVTFSHYRKGNLHYMCENGFEFRVPINDTGDATFLPTDKGMLYMRWIRKEIENYEKETKS